MLVQQLKYSLILTESSHWSFSPSDVTLTPNLARLLCPWLCNGSYGNWSLATNPCVYSSKPLCRDVQVAFKSIICTFKKHRYYRSYTCWDTFTHLILIFGFISLTSTDPLFYSFIRSRMSELVTIFFFFNLLTSIKGHHLRAEAAPSSRFFLPL